MMYKKNNNKKMCAIILGMAMASSLLACDSNVKTENEKTQTVETAVMQMEGNSSIDSSFMSYESVINVDDLFSDRDSDCGYSESDAVTIDLNGKKDSVIKIEQAGTYILSGSYNGQLLIEAGESDKIHIVLKDAEISNKNDAAIYVKSADKVFFTLEGVNSVVSEGTFNSVDENNVDGTIYAKSDITFNGNGTLNVKCETAHGIVGKDDVKFMNGTYNVTSAKDGIQGKDSVRIADGTFNITAGNDGIQSSNDKKDGKGYIYIAGGYYNIVTGGGSDNAEVKTNDSMMGGFKGGMQMPGNSQQTESSTDEESTKGIKAENEIYICGGNYILDTKDDAVHCNGNICINGGTFDISAGDDGGHADETFNIIAGNINIKKSYEGIEAKYVNVSGGVVSLISSDDGFNATSGNAGVPMSFGNKAGSDNNADDSDTCNIKISGGEITINASGDGLDSNGNMYISGGKTIVYGPESNSDGALDYDGNAVITGGTVIAIGYSGMAQNFGSSSTQGTILYNASSILNKDTEIVLKDAKGNTIVSVNSPKSYNSVVISTPDIKADEKYTVSLAGNEESITMNNLTYSNGGGMNGGDMNGGGMNGEGMNGGGMNGGDMNGGRGGMEDRQNVPDMQNDDINGFGNKDGQNKKMW